MSAFDAISSFKQGSTLVTSGTPASSVAIPKPAVTPQSVKPADPPAADQPLSDALKRQDRIASGRPSSDHGENLRSLVREALGQSSLPFGWRAFSGPDIAETSNFEFELVDSAPQQNVHKFLCVIEPAAKQIEPAPKQDKGKKPDYVISFYREPAAENSRPQLLASIKTADTPRIMFVAQRIFEQIAETVARSPKAPAAPNGARAGKDGTDPS